MSNRTAEANKAISVAWEKEQQRVSEGKGTRDWTLEQQQDILKFGIAYDDEGKAFRGHHMKSVSICPEEQGNPDNIQFLSHEEHKEAHIICWQPTNWYYDPVTKQRIDFGDGPIIPCKVIDLSTPVCPSTKESVQLKEASPTENETCEYKHEEKKVQSVSKDSGKRSAVAQPVKNPTGAHNRNWFENAIDWTVEFYHRHKEVIDTIGSIVGFVAVTAATHAADSRDKHSSSQSGRSECTSNTSGDSISSVNINSVSSERIYPETHASPQEHIVPGHGQHYHTKEGVIWKEKAPYPRGGGKDE